MFASRLISSCLFTILVSACAASSGDLDDGTYSGEFAAVHAEDTAALSCPRPCVLHAAPHGFTPIREKLDQLDPALRDGAFRDALTPVGKTADGGAYQFFHGSSGRGAVYWHPSRSNGAHILYGAILEQYEALGYEASFLGYPITDEYDHDPSGARRQQFETLHFEPDVADGHNTTWQYISWFPESGAHIDEQHGHTP